MFMKPGTNEFAGSGGRRPVLSRPCVHRGGILAAAVLVGLAVLATLPPPARSDAGGPDVYGYTWTDSKFPNPGVAFSWIDGKTGGTDLLPADDGCGSGPVNLGF